MPKDPAKNGGGSTAERLAALVDGELEIPAFDRPAVTVASPTAGWLPIDPDPPKKGAGTALFENLNAALPLAMLPVRLETRYRTDLDPAELRIRVYPDQIHVDADTPEPGKGEYRLTVAFWQEWYASNDRVRREAAWARYVDQVGDRRAGYLARLLKPERKGGNRLTFPPFETTPRHRPARPRLLPDRWIALGYLHGDLIFQKSGKRIERKLRVGPDAEAEVWHSQQSGLKIDEGLAWMVDYQQAVEVGMAITIPLTGKAAAALDRVSQLLVVGVDPRHSATDLQNLLDIHARTGGMGFVPAGTATNNIESVTAGWSNRAPGTAADLDRELETPAKEKKQDNAAKLGRALGFDDLSRLRRAPNGTLDERERSRAMVAALFETVLGCYLRQLLDVQGTDGLTRQTINAGRRWCIANVTGGAPLPTIRIGPQPYGILPVMRSRSVSAAGAAGSVETVLTELVPEWRAAASMLPTLDPNDADVAGTEEHVHNIGKILATQPHPARLFTRRVSNYDDLNFIEKLLTPQSYYSGVLLGMDPAANPNIDSPNIEMAIIYNSLTGSAYSGIELQSDQTWDVTGQIAMWEDLGGHVDQLLRDQGKHDEADEAARLVINVLGVLGSYEQRQRPLRSLGLAEFEGRLGLDNTTLVQAMFHANNVEWGDVGLVEMVDAPAGSTAADYLVDLKRRFDDRSGSSLASSGMPQSFHDAEPLLFQLLEATLGLVPTGRKMNAEVSASLGLLATLRAEELTWLMRETIGLGTHRIDAWHTGLAAERIKTMRAEQPAGLNIGAFGWVTELEPRRDRKLSDGFVHTPSMAHATTAAILRAGWHSHGSNAADSIAAVNLTSDRVRAASWLLDGIREGQDLGDLLGHRFERTLHDTNGDRFIHDVRERVLRAGGEQNAVPDQPVDGIALLDLWRNGSLGQLPQKVRRALQSLAATFDAVNDVGLFEAVHQLTLGNHDRATAMLETMAAGISLPPELRGPRTTRASTGVEHRVVVVMPFDGPVPGGWSTGVRDAVAPGLERWVAGLLPAAEDVGLTITTDSGSDSGVTLTDLQLSALDAVYLVGDNPEVVGPALATLASAHAGGVAVTVAPTGSAAVDLVDFSVLAVEIRRSISTWRAADARDLRRPDDPGNPDVDLGQARAAVLAAIAALDRANDVLSDVLTTSSDPTTIRAALARFGLAAGSTAGDMDEGWRTLEQVADRLRLISGVPIDEDAGAAGGGISDRPNLGPAKRAAALFGAPLPIAGQFTVAADPDAGQAMPFDPGLADQTEIDDWLDATGRVRPEVGRLSTIGTLSDLLTGRNGLQAIAGQYPRRPGEPWAAVGLPTADTGGRTSVVAVGAGPRSPFSGAAGGAGAAGAVVTGLVVDQWSERIPSNEVTTGMTFQFDAPSNRPPQSWLLAALPEDENTWSLRIVVETLLETLEWAELRTVGPEDLLDFGRAIPTVMAPGFIQHPPDEEDS